MPLPLFWIALDTDKGRHVFLQRGLNSSSAMVRACIAGMTGSVVDIR